MITNKWTPGARNEPRYPHDCAACIYLGQYELADLYFCPGGPSFIARFGEGSDYESGTVFAAVSHAIGEAVTRAYEAGLWYTPGPSHEYIGKRREQVARFSREMAERYEKKRENNERTKS